MLEYINISFDSTKNLFGVTCVNSLGNVTQSGRKFNLTDPFSFIEQNIQKSLFVFLITINLKFGDF